MFMSLLHSLKLSALKILKPLVVFVGGLHAPYTHNKITGREYHRISNALRVGDVLITRKRGEVTNLFIPGFYTHAAMYVGRNDVVEAIGKGVVRTDLVSFCMGKDYVAVLRSKFSDEAVNKEAAKEAIKLIGSPYDYDFEPANVAFYCSELCYYAYDKALGEDKSPFELRQSLGVDTVTPQDFFDATEKWERILVTDRG